MRSIFPSDDPLAVEVVIFLARIDELGTIAEGLHRLRRSRRGVLGHQLFLVRASASAIHEICKVIGQVKVNVDFQRGLRRRRGILERFEAHGKELTREALVVERVRNTASAHFDRGAIRRALVQLSETNARFTLATTLAGAEFDHVHLCMATSMLKTKVARDDLMASISEVVQSITRAHTAAVHLVDPVLFAYQDATGRIFPR